MYVVIPLFVHYVYFTVLSVSVYKNIRSIITQNAFNIAWYDLELQQYQKERTDTELERIFDERNTALREGGLQVTGIHVKPKEFKGTETEWQQFVKNKKSQEYYNKIQELENEQVTKEVKLRESSHQFAIPGEKIVNSSMAKGMAQKYQENL